MLFKKHKKELSKFHEFYLLDKKNNKILNKYSPCSFRSFLFDNHLLHPLKIPLGFQGIRFEGIFKPKQVSIWATVIIEEDLTFVLAIEKS